MDAENLKKKSPKSSLWGWENAQEAAEYAKRANKEGGGVVMERAMLAVILSAVLIVSIVPIVILNVRLCREMDRYNEIDKELRELSFARENKRREELREILERFNSYFQGLQAQLSSEKSDDSGSE